MGKEIHKHFNTLLALTVIGLSLYALFLPFIPQIDFWIRSQGSISDSISRKIQSTSSPEVDQPNALLIPAILLEENIVTGSSIGVIEEGGVWLRPMSTAPDQPGNIILAGHRFTYQNPNGPFYNLDKIAVGDEIGVRWDNVMRTYAVESIETVPSNATYIERQTDDSRLTLYTCTPLLTAENRLVIIAKER